MTARFLEILLDYWDLQKGKTYMTDWVFTTYKIAAVYVIFVFLGPKLMKAREAFKLDLTLGLWNLTMFTYSALCAYNLIPELWNSYQTDGFVGSYCYNRNYHRGPSGWWVWSFAMSKCPELIDTVFLVLRKKPVLFLHWYHHAATFVYSVFNYNLEPAWARWIVGLNLIVHTIMYLYFAIRAFNVKTPRFVAQFITTIQLVQFVICLYIFFHLLYIKSANTIADCEVSWNALAVGGAMYASYLYLFSQFFYSAYVKKRAPKKHAE